MRIFLFILGVFAAVVCFEKPAAARNNAWCAYLNFAGGATTLETPADDICSYPPRLVLREQLGGRVPVRVVPSRITAARSFLWPPRLTDSFLLFAESERSSFP